MTTSKFDELYQDALAGRINRREVLRRGLALGISVPALTTLLAACNGDDDDDDVAVDPDPVDDEDDDVDPEVDDEEPDPDDEVDDEPDDFEGVRIRWSTALAEVERAVFDNTILPDFQ
jgi:hypothetical protein